jgi:anti-sigma factor RsiW
VTCPSEQLQRLHDDQLSAAEAARVRAHVAGCESCRKTLADFAAVSDAVRSASLPRPTPAMLARWKAAAQWRRERSVRRLAGWLSTAAAAAIAVAVVTGGKGESVDTASLAISPWEAAMLTPAAAEATPTQVAANWMAADLSAGGASWR